MKPETRLMRALFEPPLDPTLGDDDLAEEIDGITLTNAIDSALDSLRARDTPAFTARAKKVLLLRFGFTDGRPRTLVETGEELNLSRERIRQIESKALWKLQWMLHFRRGPAEQLRGYIKKKGD